MAFTLVSLGWLALVAASPVDLANRACTNGQWQCAGNVLQQCDQQAWVAIEDCDTNKMVCSSSSPVVACIYSWQAAEFAVSGGVSETTVGAAVSTSSPIVPGPVTTTAATTALSISVSMGSSVSLPTTGTGTSVSAPTASTSVTPYTGTWSAPHYVAYADSWITQPPAVSALGSINRFIMGFWTTTQSVAGQDDAQGWTMLDAATRSQILSEYHAAGIALMVSAFGQTNTPTTLGADPTQTAQEVAAWVKEYGFDGVDVDYEDFAAVSAGGWEAWIITFHTELRNQLGSNYLITHAPVAPWFSKTSYPTGGYSLIYSKCPDIDFFNLQFYNQYALYTDCTSLITSSESSSAAANFPGSALLQINSEGGVPLNKLVLGKPVLTADQSNGGWMAASDLATCVSQAKSSGWNGGIMMWQWHTDGSAASFLASVIGS